MRGDETGAGRGRTEEEVEAEARASCAEDEKKRNRIKIIFIKKIKKHSCLKHETGEEANVRRKVWRL